MVHNSILRDDAVNDPEAHPPSFSGAFLFSIVQGNYFSPILGGTLLGAGLVSRNFCRFSYSRTIYPRHDSVLPLLIHSPPGSIHGSCFFFHRHFAEIYISRTFNFFFFCRWGAVAIPEPSSLSNFRAFLVFFPDASMFVATLSFWLFP